MKGVWALGVPIQLARERAAGAHIDAGADHVAVQVIGIAPGESATPYRRLLTPALQPWHAAPDGRLQQ